MVQDETRRKLYVCHLHPKVSKEELILNMEVFGQIQEAQINYHPMTQKPRGFGFVLFEDEASVKEALSYQEKTGGIQIHGKSIEFKPVLTRQDA